MSSFSTPVTVDAAWERPAIATGRGETFLVVSVSAGRSAHASRVPVDLALVIDRSGSMAGDRLELAKAGVRAALDVLRPRDRASLIAFDHEVVLLAPLANLDASPRGTDLLAPFADHDGSARRAMERLLDRLDARGSTDLFGGWRAGCESITERPDRLPGRRVRRTLLLTDGHANVGTTDPSAIAHHATQLRVRGVTTSTLGVGGGIDEHLLAGMAEAGGGNFASTEHPGELPAFFARELGELLSISALDATLRLTLPKGLRATLLNPYPVDRVKKDITVQLGDLPAGLTVNLVFSVTGRFTGPATVGPVEAVLDWVDPEGDRRRSTPVPVAPVAVVSPGEYERSRRDDRASEQVARIRSERAKREAITHYRAGREEDARSVLGFARDYAMSAPMPASDLTVHELDELIAADPSGPAFATVSRRTLNESHRRSRGREV